MGGDDAQAIRLVILIALCHHDLLQCTISAILPLAVPEPNTRSVVATPSGSQPSGCCARIWAAGIRGQLA